MQSRLFLNVVIGERSAIFQLFARKDEPLLVGRNALFVLNFGFNVPDGIRRLHPESGGLAREGLHKNLDAIASSGTSNITPSIKLALIVDVRLIERFSP
jgi:hypothetical protein